MVPECKPVNPPMLPVQGVSEDEETAETDPVENENIIVPRFSPMNPPTALQEFIKP
jgi:hypothetical protein